MKNILTLLLLLTGLELFSQTTIYENNFDGYEDTTLEESEDFSIEAFQQADLERNISVIKEGDESFLQLSIATTNASANTLIKLNQTFVFKAGVEYTYSALTRGKFRRKLSVVNIVSGDAVYSSSEYNAQNDDALASEWQELSITFTPEVEFEGTLNILRIWNGNLEVDTIQLISSESPEEEETLPSDFEIYKASFSNYDNDVSLDDEFSIIAFQQDALARTIKAKTENDEQFARLTIESTNASANTLIKLSQIFDFKAGVEYSFSAKTRGKFGRKISVTNVDTGDAVFVSNEYSARNDDALAANWHQHNITFTPTDDFKGQLNILRLWNGSLDVDDIRLGSSIEEEVEEEEPTNSEPTDFEVYNNQFTDNDNTTDLTQNGFNILSYQQTELERTLLVVEEGENKFARLTIAPTNTSANTLVTVTKEFNFKGGVEYSFIAKTRGKFARKITITDADIHAVFEGEGFNAKNDDSEATKWHQHSFKFTPTEDFIGQINVLRTWNGNLDIDDIRLGSSIEEEEDNEEEDNNTGEEEDNEEEDNNTGEEEDNNTSEEEDNEEEDNNTSEEENNEEGEVTSISSIEKELFSIYPSPTSSIIHLKMIDQNTVKFNIIITNINGQTVQTFNNLNINSNGTTLKLSDKLDNGIYLVRVISSSNQITKRLILQR